MAASLSRSAAARQVAAHRPGTRAGRHSAVRLYLAFCANLGINHKRHTYIHVCWFIEYLAKYGYSPGAISNTVSHLRTFYKLAGLSTTQLQHYRVGLALRAAAMTIRRAGATKLPATPDVLRKALSCLHAVDYPRLVKAAIIMIFMGFLRQSSAAPPTVAAFDPSRHITRQDITIKPTGVLLNLKWTKTIQRATDAKKLWLPATTDPLLCPVRALNDYLQHAPAAPALSPFFSYPDGRPVTSRYLAKQWTVLLKEAGLPVMAYTLHSLRKGAASYAYNEAWATLNDVMTQGTWRSMAVRDYIKPPDAAHNSVHSALQRL